MHSGQQVLVQWLNIFFCSGHVIATSSAAGLPPNSCGTKTSAGLRWSVKMLGFSLTGSRLAFEASTKIISLILLCLEAISPLCVHLMVWPALGDRVLWQAPHCEDAACGIGLPSHLKVQV